MNYMTYFSKQARSPSGIFGRMYMSRVFDKGNAGLNALVYDNLLVKANDRILEIGFGTGAMIQKIAGRLNTGFVEGVDFSKTMVSIAQKKNRKFIRNGNVVIHTGDFNELHFNDNFYDTVFTVNTIYFWKNPERTISKIYRILKPGGRVLIGFNGKQDMEKMPLNKDIFRYYSTEDVIDLLSVQGNFQDISIASATSAWKTGFCAVATKHLGK